MKLIIFDVDGTLIDSRGAIMVAMKAAFQSVNSPMPDRDSVLAVVGLSLPSALKQLNDALSDEQISSMVDVYQEYFLNHQHLPAPFFDGIEEGILKLAQRSDVQLGLATGHGRRGLERLMSVWSCADMFATVQTADEHPSKPNPSMLSQCMADCDAAPRDVMMIGDTVFDIEMAKAVKAHSIGVSWGNHGAGSLQEAGAGSICGSPKDLFETLEIWIEEGR